MPQIGCKSGTCANNFNSTVNRSKLISVILRYDKTKQMELPPTIFKCTPLPTPLMFTPLPFKLESYDLVVGYWNKNPKVSDLNPDGCKIR